MTTRNLEHFDYAEEAEAAQRGGAWPQAAALWRRAAKVLRDTAPHTPATFDLHAKYQVAATACDRKPHVPQTLEGLARDKLQIPTLSERKADGLDFHELSVWQIQEALAAAYEAGRQSAK